MTERQVLMQWRLLAHGEGLAQARRKSRQLSAASFALFLASGMTAWLYDPWAFAPILPAVAVGWMVAERNAINWRLAFWPALERYLNWPLIEQTLAAEPSPSRP